MKTFKQYIQEMDTSSFRKSKNVEDYRNKELSIDDIVDADHSSPERVNYDSKADLGKEPKNPEKTPLAKKAGIDNVDAKDAFKDRFDAKDATTFADRFPK